MKQLAVFLALGSMAAFSGLAQPRFTGFVGGGFSEPINPIATRIDRGWNVSAGAGISGKNLGAMVDFTFNNFPVNQTALNNVGAPNGSTRIWGLTFDPIVHFSPRPESPVDFYITGGGGVYHRTVEFTQPAIATVTAFDPWWGVVFPVDVATNQVIGSFSVTRPGVDGGAGVAFKVGSGSLKVFAEARFHHMFTNRVDTNMIPVTFGVRW